MSVDAMVLVSVESCPFKNRLARVCSPPMLIIYVGVAALSCIISVPYILIFLGMPSIALCRCSTLHILLGGQSMPNLLGHRRMAESILATHDLLVAYGS